MTNMMKNVKMFNADSTKNAILVHSLQKNVSNNRSMKNTFLTPSLKNWFIGLMITSVALLSGVERSLAQTSTLYDLNTAGQLSTFFNKGGTATNISQTTTGGGIGNTNCVQVTGTSTNELFATKAGYSLGPVGSTYTFTSYVESIYNSGYSGLGFTTSSPTAQSGTYANPTVGLGISVHGGGFIFHNNTTNFIGSWNAVGTGGVTAVTQSSISDLLNSGSIDKWYKVILKVTRTGTSTFNMRVEIWPVTSNGVLIYPSAASAIYELNNQTNTTISTSSLLYSYFAFAGSRVRSFDNFGVDLVGSTVIQSGYPVVLTISTTNSNNTVTFNGQVTNINGSNVTERGFVYSTSTNPTISNNKVIVGSGLGTYNGVTPTLANGTYYFRAYATNSNGTSYGIQEAVTLTSNPQYIGTANSFTEGTDSHVLISLSAQPGDLATLSMTDSTALGNGVDYGAVNTVTTVGQSNLEVNTGSGWSLYNGSVTIPASGTLQARSPLVNDNLLEQPEFFKFNFSKLNAGVSGTTTYNLNYSPVDLSGLTLVSGVAETANAIYKKTNAITISGQGLDATVKLVGLSNVTANFNLDDDASNPANFQPQIDASPGASFVDFEVRFYLTGTSTLVSVQNFYVSAVDVDGSSASLREYIEVGNISNYQVDASTGLTISSGYATGFTKFLGLTSSLSGITFENTASFIANYTVPVSVIPFRMGVTAASSTTRLFSLSIGSSPGAFTTTSSSTTTTKSTTVVTLISEDTQPNSQPTISTPPNITTACGGVSNGPVNITVGDSDGALNTLVITASSSNTTLIPNGNITITQSNTLGAASLVYTPVAGQTGTSTITLTVTDAGGLTATSTFDITVTALALTAVTATLNDQPCGNTATGSINTTLTGGSGSLTYVWTRSLTLNGAYVTFTPTASPAANPTNLSAPYFIK